MIRRAPFDYAFAADDYNLKFSDEVHIGNISTVFCVLAIFISCLGLFGLASYIAEQRTKEIAVRKVLGASVPNLWKLLSSEFIKLVLSFLSDRYLPSPGITCTNGCSNMISE